MKFKKDEVAVQEAAVQKSLATCAKRINANHKTALAASRLSEEKGKEAIKAAIVAGKNLLAAKAMVEHGGWLKWFAKNCPGISEDTSERYRRLAEHAANSAYMRNLEEAGSLRQAYIVCDIIQNDAHIIIEKGGKAGAAKSKRGTSTNSIRPQPSEFVKAKGLAVQLWHLLTSTTHPERMAKELQPVIQWYQDFVAQKKKREAALNDGFDDPQNEATLSFRRETKKMSVEGYLRIVHAGVPFAWNYVNFKPTQGGAHLEGFGAALRDVVPHSTHGCRELNFVTNPDTGAHIKVPHSFIGALHLRTSQPRFAGPTKDILMGDDVREFV